MIGLTKPSLTAVAALAITPLGQSSQRVKANLFIPGRWAGFVLGFLLLVSARADDPMPIMPLADIKPGMIGEWHSTVVGSRVDSFPMQVVGIAENFIGPQRPVIICKALDATNRLTGPVAGMSGSPVFIDGKLIGAYAYGWTWPKDQALIGVTPIESMLEVETNYPPANPPAVSEQHGANRNRGGSGMAGCPGGRASICLRRPRCNPR